MSDRPLWRISSKELLDELRRRAATGRLRDAVPALTAILQARGYVVLPAAGDVPFDAEEGRGTPEQLEAWDRAFSRPSFLGKRWPPEGGDDD